MDWPPEQSCTKTRTSVFVVPSPLKGRANAWVPVMARAVLDEMAPLDAFPLGKVVRSTIQPSTVPDSKSQLPQLGRPPTPGQLNVVPLHVLAHWVPPQAAAAFGCRQSRQPDPQCM